MFAEDLIEIRFRFTDSRRVPTVHSDASESARGRLSLCHLNSPVLYKSKKG